MTFYNNRVVAVERLDDGIYLARKIDKNIVVDYVKQDTNIFTKEVVINNTIGEFDLDMDQDSNIHILYINDKHDLILFNIMDNERDSKIILKGIKSRIFELALVNLGNIQNIFFMQKTDNKKIFRIYHIYIEEGKTMEFLVDEIETYEIINPLRIIKDEKRLIISYYFKNQICIKEFDILKKLWSPSITLTDNKNKLYLDLMLDGDSIHLVYADFNKENFKIKYERFLYDNEYILKQKELDITNTGNYTDPILIKIGEFLWICWKATNQLLSIYSTDNGNTWSDIYKWKESKNMDIVKYKYITDILDDRIKLEYAYGSINKDIKFMGFGDLKHAELLEVKKVIT